MKKIFLLSCFSIIFGCSSSSDFHNLNENIEDGLYCANVQVETNKSIKKYQLTITVKNNYLQKIDWPNKGWLDNTHYKLPEFYENEATFIDDRGRKFDLKIIQEGKCK